jgi:LAO/AO transport system kinase
MSTVSTDLAPLVTGVRAGERRALAKAITLIESRRPEDERVATALLTAVAPDEGRALRVAVSGAPGVGKSTLIESLGLHAVARGLRTAVLTIDPSSRVSGGSILGDKTRMPRLAVHPMAFIRPSPAGNTLGGVARRTRETMLLMDAAGFELVLIETVGVGQSETEVDAMVDLFVLVLLPNAGDELQGIKRGIMELAQIVLVNKADGLFADAAATTCHQVRSALQLLHHHGSGTWLPHTLAVSAMEERGIDGALELLLEFRQVMTGNGALQDKRRRQATAWMWERVHEGLRARFLAHPVVHTRLTELVPRVRTGDLGAVEAAGMLLDAFTGSEDGKHAGNYRKTGPAAG